MAGIELRITDIGGFRTKMFLHLLSQIDATELLESIGTVVESQVRRRIKHEKKSPDGKDWKKLGHSPGSEKYERWKKKVSSGGLLELHEGLYDSIQFEVRGDELIAGSNLVYSWTHQVGDKREAPSWSGAGRSGGKMASSTHTVEIPARPYLGLSSENRDELEEVIGDWINDQVRRFL